MTLEVIHFNHKQYHQLHTRIKNIYYKYDSLSFLIMHVM